ncbi:hypothetical protein SELMODRAFT_114956 [Selaginella moellendorffii]|nr:hypothetical protein SELMODRAFT_114956 [Selaginella moellendorffii]
MERSGSPASDDAFLIAAGSFDRHHSAFDREQGLLRDDGDEQQQWEALVEGVLDCSADAQSESIGGQGYLDAQHQDDDDHRAAENATSDSNKEEKIELVDLLVACAQAISAKSTSLIHCLLARLGELASPHGSTAMERLAAYFTEGLACRLASQRPDLYKPLSLETDPSPGSACSSEAEEESIAAYHILNHVSPIVKFAHFSANDAILEAFQGRKKVHVIDLDVGQGLQWPALFQALANRSEGPPSLVRISGIGPFKDSVQETGDRLAEFAQALGLCFEFHAVVERLEEIRLWMLHVKDGEAVAVNCIGQLHRSLLDRQQIQGVMELIRSTKPEVVAIVEHEAEHNVECFEARFAGSLRYYAAMFDALDSSVVVVDGESSLSARTRVEKTIFAREIRNIVGCEGEDRIERHERFEGWKRMLEEEGFRNRGMSQRAIVQAKLLLEMFLCPEYRIDKLEGKDENGSRECCEGITLGWLDQPLVTVSAWSLIR